MMKYVFLLQWAMGIFLAWLVFPEEKPWSWSLLGKGFLAGGLLLVLVDGLFFVQGRSVIFGYLLSILS